MTGMTRYVPGGADGPARPYRVLVVEDDPTVVEVLLVYLRRAGLAAAHLADGRAALAAIDADPPDLVLLDLMLPGLDGLEVCRRIRESAPDLPVVMLTARGEVADRIVGLEVGADDYVLKPFSPREVVLRVDSVLRRSRGERSAPARMRDGDLVVDTTARSASLRGDILALTNREFDLLAFLVEHAGQAFSRDELLRQVWGWEIGDRSTVTVHVRRLRAKVEPDPARPRRLRTVWGVGYRWDAA